MEKQKGKRKKQMGGLGPPIQGSTRGRDARATKVQSSSVFTEHIAKKMSSKQPSHPFRRLLPPSRGKKMISSDKTRNEGKGRQNAYFRAILRKL